MSLHQHASVLSSSVVADRARTEAETSFAAVVLWVALGLVLTLALARLDPAAVAALQLLS